MRLKSKILTILLIIGILFASCSAGSGSDYGGGGGLAAPTGLVATGTSSTSISLSWTTVSGAAKYKIYQSVTSTGVYSYVDQTEYGTYVVNNLTSSHTYYYKVSSVDVNGIEGPQSTYAEGRTFEAAIPLPGSVRAAAISSVSIQINWNVVTGAMNYKVYRSSTVSGTYQLISTRTDTTYTDTGLTPLTTYYYRVSALTAIGESEQSDPISATTPAENVVPAPGGFQASPLSSTSIQITWIAVQEATSYRIYRSENASGPYVLVGTSTTTSYNNTGLSPSTLYYYKVSTVHSRGESEQSSPISAMTPAETPVQPPTGLNASAVSNSIRITWNGASGATGYKVYRSSGAAGTYNFLGSTSASPYTDSGLSLATTYYYKVSSIKGDVESELSAYVSATTPNVSGGTIDFPPTTPTGLVVSSVSSGSITLTWNSVSTADSYNVYRSNALNGADAKINTSQIINTSYTDSVPAGAGYYYKVVGVNSSGESPKSTGAFAYASSHYTLSYYASAQTLSLAASGKHYYRLAVTQGYSYTIEWQNGNNQAISDYIHFRITAYQNDGTQIFNRDSWSSNGYTNPSVFTATATGFVTVLVANDSSSSQNYQIYYY